MFHLNAQSDENQLLIPHFSDAEKALIDNELKLRKIKDHFLIASSGTGGSKKAYLISKDSLFCNARAVNDRLNLNEDDQWGASLPFYHIGGLSIHFRAALLNQTPIDMRPWSPLKLTETLVSSKISVFSLVPTQVYDVVRFNVSAPKNIKAVLVGGDFLGQELAKRFQQLGWPLVRTFGMTEVSSQLCTGVNSRGHFSPLPIHQIRLNERGQILVKSSSLFSHLIAQKNGDWIFHQVSDFLDEDGFYPLPDRGALHDGFLEVLGRDDGQLKSSGHLINFTELKEELEKFLLSREIWGEIEIEAKRSERQGIELILHHLEKIPLSVIEDFVKSISPVRFSAIIAHSEFKRTELGKFKAS